MSSYMTGELLLFARAVWYGACLLLLYDVLRILRRTIHHGPVWTAVEDILYWVFCAVWLFSRFYQGSGREFHPYNNHAKKSIN